MAEAEAHLRLDATNSEPRAGAPVAALAGAGAGSVTAGAHRYLVTFVTATGETDAGTASAAVTVADAAVNGKVAVSSIPLGGSAVTARKLYRTAAGGSTYLLLATIANNTATTYTDNVADAALGAGAPSTNTTSDPLVSALITAAREYAELETGRALVTQTWTLTLDQFPGAGDTESGSGEEDIELPYPTLQAVTEIRYVDDAGVTQVLSPSIYVADTTSLPGRVILAYDQTWPISRLQRNAIEVDFRCGYGAAAAVPAGIKQAMLLLIGHWYANREVVVIGHIVAEVPKAVDALLGQHRYRMV